MQHWLIVNKLKLIKIWYALLIAWFLFFLVSIPLLGIRQWVWLGQKSASISIVVFWLTLMPGILKRFKITGVLLPLRTVMMLYRRQMGITMYVFALTHHWWVRFLPILKINGDFWQFSLFEWIGFTAFVLLTPVFITSNEWSVRTLGHFWRTLHALVYIVVWLLFLHIALQGTSWQAFVTLVVASLETFSLIWDKLKNPPVAPLVQQEPIKTLP